MVSVGSDLEEVAINNAYAESDRGRRPLRACAALSRKVQKYRSLFMSRAMTEPPARSDIDKTVAGLVDVGTVRYRGVDYQGKHEPIIDKQTFGEVQRLLEAHNFAGEKQRLHHHYLKGSIFCGKENRPGSECRCRLIVCNAKSRSGLIYPYFVCIGRQRNPKSCAQKALLIEHVEEAVVDPYKNIVLGNDLMLQTEQVKRGHQNREAPIRGLAV